MTRVALALAAALAWVAVLAAPATLPAQASPSADSVGPRRWTLRVNDEVGRPTGWVQVRENRIAGSRLAFGSGLGIHAVSALGLTLEIPAGSGAVGMAVDGTTLRGSTLLSQPVYFNGSTLAGGTVLRTRTEAGDFLRVVIDYEHGLARVGARGARGALTWRAGLDATLLNFRLQGTLDPTTAGRETKEDFVTQELPAPFVGAGLTLPVGHRATVRLGVDGGGLPWVSSLRYEGGLVSLTQRRLDADAGIDVALEARLTVGAGVHATSFTQNEQSHEDGNQFSMASTAAALRLTWAF